jgi:hypothetical protein
MIDTVVQQTPNSQAAAGGKKAVREALEDGWKESVAVLEIEDGGDE